MMQLQELVDSYNKIVPKVSLIDVQDLFKLFFPPISLLSGLQSSATVLLHFNPTLVGS